MTSEIHPRRSKKEGIWVRHLVSSSTLAVCWTGAFQSWKLCRNTIQTVRRQMTVGKSRCFIPQAHTVFKFRMKKIGEFLLPCRKICAPIVYIPTAFAPDLVQMHQERTTATISGQKLILKSFRDRPIWPPKGTKGMRDNRRRGRNNHKDPWIWLKNSKHSWRRPEDWWKNSFLTW